MVAVCITLVCMCMCVGVMYVYGMDSGSVYVNVRGVTVCVRYVSY